MQFAHTVWAYLAHVSPYLPYALTVLVPCWVVPWGIRSRWPHAWERFARMSDSLMASAPFPIDPAGKFAAAFSKTFQAIPAALLGALALSVATGANPHDALKGAALGLLAPVWHEFLKMFTPYIGGKFPAAGLGAQK